MHAAKRLLKMISDMSAGDLQRIMDHNIFHFVPASTFSFGGANCRCILRTTIKSGFLISLYRNRATRHLLEWDPLASQNLAIWTWHLSLNL